ncbi:TPR repeat protein [Calycina marina]|uniref:Succinate dehydrogenase assembly factor 2, mitochondrial n=1 Tax=Calycina marina TaxID=1763456 RepID=A0A9P7ZBI6_9HELO|nr:TPR repeat protein [Calycina marina]
MSSLRSVFRATQSSRTLRRSIALTPRVSSTENQGPKDPNPLGEQIGNKEHEPATDGEMGVGEMEGANFKVEPLHRTGEDTNTMRARLLYQSRKRGTLESDLLMSTFADTYLAKMTKIQMAQYDKFLDENDWDIYYWATQDPLAESSVTAQASNAAAMSPTPPKSGEWAQTIGTFKPAYRPVPIRWKNSEILSMLRKHVISRSAGGVHEIDAGVSGEGLNQSVKGTGGGGMAFMPPVFQTDQPQ